MILICGIPSEPPVALVTEAAARLGVPCVTFSQRESCWADLVLESLAGTPAGTLFHRNETHRLDSFTGIYVRLMDWRSLPESRHREPGATERMARMNELLSEWIEWTPARVMNRNCDSASNSSKPYQAGIILSAGFRVPETLITTDPAEVSRFAAGYGPLIYKSVSSVRSIVRHLDRTALDRIQRVRCLPTQFQQYIEGTDVRVHVAGDEIFATRIRSEAVDYRYAGREGGEVSMEPVELQPSVMDRCFDLSRRLGLALCGIDLRESVDGEWYCFEANPSPAFSYYQDNTGQPIADAIVRYLSPAA